MNITKGKVAKAQKVVIYGTEGIGKTSFAAQFPDALFIDTEGSTSNMDIARMDRPSSWEMLNQQVDWVKNNQPCKTLVIDTFDWAEQLATNQVVSDGNKKSITGFGYGEGFIQLEETVGKFLNKLTDLIEIGINVVLTAHAKVTRFEAPDEMGAYDRYELKLGNKTTAKTAALVKEWADMVLFFNYKVHSVATDDKGTRFKGQGGIRTMYATHHPAWDAKNRHGLPAEMPMDYGQIAHIFVPQGDQSEPVEQAPPVQQSEQPVSNTNTLEQQQTQNEPMDQQSIQQEPTQQQDQQPIQNNEQPVAGLSPEESQPNNALSSNIPKELRDLMELHQVSEEEIQIAVSSRGYYPQDTPIENYDSEFINGVLVSAWEQMHAMIKEFRESVPFK